MKVLRALSFFRDGCLILGVVVSCLVGLELCADGYYLLRRGLHPESAQLQKEVEYLANSDVYRSAPWKAEFLRELLGHTTQYSDLAWHPYVYWRSKPGAEEYFHIDERGIRRTRNFCSPLEAKVHIYLFGGSTMWGYGTRDDDTIPSLLAGKLKERGFTSFYVTNLGEIGYVSTQEVIQLLLELRQGHRPSIVIFYDGANDMYSALEQEVAGLPYNEDNRRREFNLTKHVSNEIFLAWLQTHSGLVTALAGLKNKLLPPASLLPLDVPIQKTPWLTKSYARILRMSDWSKP